MTLSIPSDIWKPEFQGYNVPECTVLLYLRSRMVHKK